MDWVAELDLDPTSGWLRMRTRQLGDRPWLLVDEDRAAQLRLKRYLLARHGRDVFDALPGCEAAGAEVLQLVVDELPESSPPPDGRLHPLDAAGRLVQEDLCVLRHRAQRWHLDAASLCFPSRWRLADKLGHPMTDVHSPVTGYATTLGPRVDRFLDRLGPTPVWRRNWFVHPDPSLHQPTVPPGGDPTIPEHECLHALWLRSERQTLRRLEATGDVLFTIRVQRCSIGELVARTTGRPELARYLAEAPPDDLAHRGLAPHQVVLLRGALRQRLA